MSTEMQKKQYYFTLKGALSRLKKEYNYYTDIPWSLDDVGTFWDTVTDYDDINSTLYPYFRRFTNSYELSKKYQKVSKSCKTSIKIQKKKQVSKKEQRTTKKNK